MTDMRELKNAIQEQRLEAIKASGNPDYEPLIAVYVSPSFYLKLTAEVSRMTSSYCAEYSQDGTIEGHRIWVATSPTFGQTEHPNFNVVVVDA